MTPTEIIKKANEIVAIELDITVNELEKRLEADLALVKLTALEKKVLSAREMLRKN